jgi:hypothetical protein
MPSKKQVALSYLAYANGETINHGNEENQLETFGEFREIFIHVLIANSNIQKIGLHGDS